MRNNISMFILFTIMFCMGCEQKKENGCEQIHEFVKYYSINEKDLASWDGLVDENDFTCGPNGKREKDIILTAETAAMVGEALKRSALRDKDVEESPKIVIDKSKYWVVQGSTGRTQDNSMFVYIAVIQKSNGKVLEFRIVEK